MPVELDIDMTRSLIGQRLPWENDWKGGKRGTFEVTTIGLAERNVYLTTGEWEWRECYVVARGPVVKKDGTLGSTIKNITIDLPDVPQVDLQMLMDRQREHLREQEAKYARRMKAISDELHGPSDPGGVVIQSERTA